MLHPMNHEEIVSMIVFMVVLVLFGGVLHLILDKFDEGNVMGVAMMTVGVGGLGLIGLIWVSITITNMIL